MHTVSRLLIKKFALKTEREAGLPGGSGEDLWPQMQQKHWQGSSKWNFFELQKSMPCSGLKSVYYTLHFGKNSSLWHFFFDIFPCLFPTWVTWPWKPAAAATAGDRLGLGLLRSPILTHSYCLTSSAAFWKTPRVVTLTGSELSSGKDLSTEVWTRQLAATGHHPSSPRWPCHQGKQEPGHRWKRKI